MKFPHKICLFICPYFDIFGYTKVAIFKIHLGFVKRTLLLTLFMIQRGWPQFAGHFIASGAIRRPHSREKLQFSLIKPSKMWNE